MARCRHRRCTRSAQTGRGGYCIAHSVLCLIQGCLLYAQYQCLGMCQGHYEQHVMSFVYDEDNDSEYNPEDANSDEESTTDDDSDTEEEDDNLNLQAELEQNSDDEDEQSDDDEEQNDEEQDLDVDDWGGRGGDENMFDDDDNGGGGDDDEGGNVGDPDNDEVVPPEVEGQQEEPPVNNFALEDAVQQPPDNIGNSNTKKRWHWFGVIISVLCFSVSCGAAIKNYATATTTTSDLTSSKRTAHTNYTDIVIDSSTNSLISAAGEGSNVTSLPSDITNRISSLIKMFPLVINRTLGYTLDDDEEEATNGTSSSGFSYTVESVATKVSSHSQLFMDDYIYSLDTPSLMFMVDVINPSFVEAEVVDFVCIDIRECVDIRQSLYFFTRDVSCPATTVTTEEEDTVYMKVLACITIVWALYVSLSSVEKDDGKGDDEAGDGGEQSALDADDEGDDEEVGDGGEQSALDADNSPEAPNIRDQMDYFSSPGPSRVVEAMLRG